MYVVSQRLTTPYDLWSLAFSDDCTYATSGHDGSDVRSNATCPAPCLPPCPSTDVRKLREGTGGPSVCSSSMARSYVRRRPIAPFVAMHLVTSWCLLLAAMPFVGLSAPPIPSGLYHKPNSTTPEIHGTPACCVSFGGPTGVGR